MTDLESYMGLNEIIKFFIWAASFIGVIIIIFHSSFRKLIDRVVKVKGKIAIGSFEFDLLLQEHDSKKKVAKPSE